MSSDFLLAYTLGLLTPLTALCVLPLYPGFLVFLSSRVQTGAKRLWVFGLLATAGVTVFMLVLGVVFTLVFEISLSRVTHIISPIAFGILAVISLLLLADFDFSRIFRSVQTPTAQNAYVQAFLFGLFFGAIVLPCNPGFLAALLAQATTVSDAFVRVAQFLLFGLGIGTPLIALTLLPQTTSKRFVSFLARHKTAVNRVAGALMLAISLYYLVIVFRVFG